MSNSANTIGISFRAEGEKELKQALGNINDSLKVNKSELKLATAELDNNGRSQDGLKSISKVLSDEITTQKSKVELLEKALQKSSTEYGEASKKTRDYQVKVNDAKTELSKMTTALDKNNDELKKQDTAMGNSSKTGNGFKGVLDKLSTGLAGSGGVGSSISGVIGTLSGAGGFIPIVGLAVTGTLSYVGALSKIAIESAGAADGILTLSTQTRLSTETIQAFNYASGFLDVSTETLTGSMAKMIKSMSSAKDGTGDAADAFKKLHISVKDSHGQLADSEKTFYKTIDALGKISNETERDALSMQIFGKSAQELNPLIDKGSEALKKYSEEAVKMGYSLSEEDLEKQGKLDDAMVKLDLSLTAVKNSMALMITPSLIGFLDSLVKPLASVTKLMTDLNKITEGTATALAKFFKSGIYSDEFKQGYQNYQKYLANGSPKSVSRNATGTNNFVGGWSLVGERGAELVHMPAASKVMSNEKTQKMLGGSIQNIYNLTIAAETLQQAADVYKILEDVAQTRNAGRETI